MNGTALGQKGELRAVQFLKENGLEILNTNFHSRFGEIDIIAQSEDTLHFIEVKTSNGDYDPLFRITPQKLQKIIKTINYYLLKKRVNKDFQVDAIIIKHEDIEWIKNISY